MAMRNFEVISDKFNLEYVLKKHGKQDPAIWLSMHKPSKNY
jgi:hypothetical protein